MVLLLDLFSDLISSSRKSRAAFFSAELVEVLRSRSGEDDEPSASPVFADLLKEGSQAKNEDNELVEDC